MILRFKGTVNPAGVSREMWFAIGAMAAIHWRMFGRPMVVTSLVDGAHGTHTLHYAGQAADVRTRELSENEKQSFHQVCAELLGRHGFDLVAEGPPWNERAPHEHCEFDPKEGEEFLVWEGV
jgi:hypothetical protein